MTDTELLEKYIKESGYKKGKLADSLGISLAAFAKKVKGQREFKASEIQILCTMLGIVEAVDKERVFFAQ